MTDQTEAMLRFLGAAHCAGRLLAVIIGADTRASARTLVRLARVKYPTELRRYEAAVRPALVEYVKANRAGDPRWTGALTPDAQFLLEHFDRYTEVPITASWVKRVVIFVRRNYRAWRKADEGHVD